VEISGAQNLLIDADDTLWENNVYFERVITKVTALLDEAGADTSTFRAQLDDTERRRIPHHGYGTVNFSRSLVETFERFLPEPSGSASAEVQRLALSILEHPVEVLEGVPETLAYLSSRHPLFLVTKGNHEEQSGKIRKSRLGHFFQGFEILHEKDTQAFARLLQCRSWEPSRSWMIGNSPRSDIHPALAAGMNAVYIPHVHTWTLEHEEPVSHPCLIELDRFSELRLHF
jgi:putative hydrolase of the HAD superfamily